MRHALLIPFLALAACGPSAEERAARDAADVAAVKAIENAPAPYKAVNVSALGREELGRIDLAGPHCLFRQSGQVLQDPALVFDRRMGWLKVDDALVKVASDSGSEKIRTAAYTHYIGKQVTLRIVPQPGATPATVPSEGADASGAGSADKDLSFPARLTVRDPYDRVVWEREGEVVCAGSVAF